MITFAPMSPLVVFRSVPHRPLPAPPRRRRLLTLAALASLIVLHSRVAHAQATLGHTDDAIPIPGGWVRLSIGNAWERHETRFGDDGGIRGLGEELSTDSLGPRQLPGLAPIEGALKTLTQNPAQRLTF